MSALDTLFPSLRGVVQTGGNGRPCLWTDFNDLRTDDECDVYAATDLWKLEPGQAVVVRDSDGLKADAVVSGPWLGSGRFVGVRLVGDFEYPEYGTAE